MTLPSWLDGIRGRVALVLLAALLLQFAGGELIFTHIERERVQQDRAARLAERIAVAERLVMRLPRDQRQDMARHLWRRPLTVRWTQEGPPPAHMATSSILAPIRDAMQQAEPKLAGKRISLARTQGDDLTGYLLLADGSWLRFRSVGHFAGWSILYHYLASVALLLACALLVGALLSRMVGRPLRRLVQAADEAGRGAPVTVAVEGPQEVRQAAAAFHAMQDRLLGMVRERIQSLAAVSHDLRTPLARLKLHAGTIADAGTRTAIEQDVKEMESFITSVLDYLRGDNPEAVVLADIASILTTISDEAQDMGASVSFSGPRRLERPIQPVKLKRIVTNLVENAVRHGGNARILLDDTPTDIVITVEDDGPGIPEDALANVLEPFFRLEASRSRDTGGIGLGLSIASRLTARLGGTLTLSNRAAGGLSATILLPKGPMKS